MLLHFWWYHIWWPQTVLLLVLCKTSGFVEYSISKLHLILLITCIFGSINYLHDSQEVGTQWSGGIFGNKRHITVCWGHSAAYIACCPRIIPKKYLCWRRKISCKYFVEQSHPLLFVCVLLGFFLWRVLICNLGRWRCSRPVVSCCFPRVKEGGGGGTYTWGGEKRGKSECPAIMLFLFSHT